MKISFIGAMALATAPKGRPTGRAATLVAEIEAGDDPAETAANLRFRAMLGWKQFLGRAQPPQSKGSGLWEVWVHTARQGWAVVKINGPRTWAADFTNSLNELAAPT